jgi:DNA-binding SARP family transcriptional activator
MQHEIRIRILGDLEVAKPDGETVPADEWRTGKTMDLLRLLALHNGRPVRPGGLIDKLWPSVPPDRGRASLRTASSQIRRATGVNCVVRHSGGLVLQDAWVDAVQYVEDARQVHVAAREAHHAHLLAVARAAERLYIDDFHAYDDESDWARAEREHLAHTRLQMLCDAASAALALRFFQEALDLATTAVRIDPTSETAHRVLMAAHAELGEIGTALRVFESYRSHLADELGADPSPQTRDLHLRLLRGTSA